MKDYSGLVKALEDIESSNIESDKEIGDWYLKVRDFERELLIGEGYSEIVPHFLWHYLADADIRRKSKEYNAMQGRRIRLLLSYLRAGAMPSDDDISDPEA